MVESEGDCLVHRVVLDDLDSSAQYHGRAVGTARGDSPFYGNDFVFLASAVYIDMDGKWVIKTGSGSGTSRERFETKEQAQKRYRELKSTAPERKYPERLPYFTFSRQSISGEYEPDFDVIEAHGSLPTEIEIAFIWDNPFKKRYQLWTAVEKKCEGDGIDALRINSMAVTAEEKALAAQAERKGEKIGEKKGEKKGEKIGEKKGEKKVAMNLLKEGFSIDQVLKVTSFTKEEIISFQEEIK